MKLQTSHRLNALVVAGLLLTPVGQSIANASPSEAVLLEQTPLLRVEETQLIVDVPNRPTAIDLAPTPDPNRDRLIQPAPIPTPAPTTPVLPTPPSPAPEATPAPDASVKFFVRQINVTGSTVFKPEDLAPIIKPLEGQEVSLEQLRQAADQITQKYLDRGYITSRAVVTDQTIRDGVVQISMIEGSLSAIEVQGTQRLNRNYVKQRIGLGTGVPLSRDRLEDQLRLLKADPLFTNVEASLRPGQEVGKSVLVVTVTEAKAVTGFVGVDNYSPVSVGSVRMGLGLNYRNLTGIGDLLAASYYRSTNGGSDAFDFSYSAPVNAMNGTIQLRAAPSRNRITDEDFKALDIRGSTGLYELSYRQPMIRTPREELALSLGFSYQDGQTFLFQDLPFPFGIGPDEDGRSRTRVLKFGQEYVKRDPQGAWALRSQFNLGINIFNATVNDSPIPDGRFFSWQGQAQRVQRLGNDHLLIAQFDLQLTPDSLLPSQQFVIGGGQSVRGYRQNARSGDNGLRFSLEDRITVMRDEASQPVMQLAPFIDLGAVWNRSGNPNKLPRQTFLVTAGLGFFWQPIPNFFLRLDYGIPLIDLDDRGQDVQDSGFFFSVNYQF